MMMESKQTGTVPKNDVEMAEDVMKTLASNTDRWGKPNMVTTSQIRKFLAEVNRISVQLDRYLIRNGKKQTTLPEELVTDIQFLKVKLAYQIRRAGARDKRNPVWQFAEGAELMTRIDAIGDDVKKYQQFAKYMEALVAYHKFYGGKD